MAGSLEQSQSRTSAGVDGAARCYLCGSTDLTAIQTELRYGTGVVRHCARCDLAALDHDPEDLADYYDREYRALHGPTLGQRTDYAGIYDAYVDHQGPRVDLLRAYLTGDTRLLDVGCSSGHFLANVAPLVGEAVGVDYDSAAAAYAHERTGCLTYGMPLEETPLEHGSFDVAVAIQTMEHVPDPIGFLRLLASYVRPGGIVFVEVPNLHDPLLSVLDAPGYRRFYFHKAHLFYFAERSLLATADRAGLAGEIELTQDYHLLNHLHWLAADAPQPASSHGLGTPRLRLRPGVDPQLVEEMDDLMARFDQEYRRALIRHRVAENLVLIARM